MRLRLVGVNWGLRICAFSFCFSKLFEFEEFECSSRLFGQGFLGIDGIASEVLRGNGRLEDILLLQVRRIDGFGYNYLSHIWRLI